MAQKVKIKTRKRVRKTGGNSGYMSCNIFPGSTLEANKIWR